nr:hypothetical protein CFP56_61576 [Quercus suber]
MNPNIGGGDPSGPKPLLLGTDLSQFNSLESTEEEINNSYGIKPVTLDQFHIRIVDRHKLMGGEHVIGDDSETCKVNHVSKKTHSQHVQPRWKRIECIQENDGMNSKDGMFDKVGDKRLHESFSVELELNVTKDGKHIKTGVDLTYMDASTVEAAIQPR